MTRTLSGPFAINRTEAPREFYTPSSELVTQTGARLLPGVHVLVVNGPSIAGRLHLGLVSVQTPYGQGTRFRLPLTAVRRATKSEVRGAIALAHVMGSDFRPACTEVLYLESVLEGTPNPAPDDALKALASRPREDVRAVMTRLHREYREILHRWPTTTRRQVAAVLALLG